MGWLWPCHKHGKHIFHTTPQLMMMHHYTKFGYRRFHHFQDIVWTTAWHTEAQTLPFCSPPPPPYYGWAVRVGGCYDWHRTVMYSYSLTYMCAVTQTLTQRHAHAFYLEILISFWLLLRLEMFARPVLHLSLKFLNPCQLCLSLWMVYCKIYH